MAHYYVVRQKLDKTGAEDKVRYYGVPVTCGRVSTKKLADLVADRCSLSRGDVFASVCEIGGMILELLKDGYSVELDGLGDFYLSAGSVYGKGGERFLRLNIACPESVLKDGLERLKNGLMGLDILDDLKD